MRSKWYISTLIIILSILGAASINTTTSPNQEIVLQFSNDKVTQEESNFAVSTVKNQLLSIGIDNIHVAEQGDGLLKITYYSNTDVASIKRLLSKDKELNLDFDEHSSNNPSETPTKQESNNYDLKVNEIHEGNYSSELGGKFALELKVEYDRFSNPYAPVFIDEPLAEETDKNVKTALKSNRNIVVAIEDIKYEIPEVRAGPVLTGKIYRG